jgi:hypothetical protein
MKDTACFNGLWETRDSFFNRASIFATISREVNKDIKARILVLHGADDPHVPAQQVSAFQQEMRLVRASEHRDRLL